MLKQDQIVSYILKEGILDEGTLQKVIEQQGSSGQSIISILKKNNLVNEEQLSRIIAAENKIEFINLSPDMVDPMAAHMVTYEMANQNNIIPVKKKGNELFVAMSAAMNPVVREQIEVRTGCKVIPLAATSSAIRQAIRCHFNVQNVTRQAIASMRLKQDVSRDEPEKGEIETHSPRVANDPVTKLVSSIMAGAIDAKASDIHIEPQELDMRVRYRVDGLLRDAIGVPSSVQQEVISHIKILADMDISEHRLAQDGHITLRHGEREYDLRVSSLPATGGEKIVIRVLDKSAKKWLLDEIASSPIDKQEFRELIKNPYGMILLTGPTGCGKTTTLYSLLQELNTPEKNIVTVEDPVEYRMDGITQMQVKPIIGVTFASALRNILRQDPDIILVGEIRDFETAEIAISAALTGHLVLSTLHTNDAAGAISRLVNLGVQPFLVASALLGTVAQRLVRMVCPKCKQTYSPSSKEIEQMLMPADYDGNIKLWRSGGCGDCYNSGYSGRKAIYEILNVSREIRGMIVEGESGDNIKQQGIKEGMRTLYKSGIEQVINGTTTLEELLRLVDARTA
jgi:type IV pilus assembly protein PilB